MNNFRPIESVDVSGKRLLVRADLNVPVENGLVSDATRIERFAKGMRPLLKRGASLVILTHLGRPKGKIDPNLSVRSIRSKLAEELGVPVCFSQYSTGLPAESVTSRLTSGQVLLCENVRFEPGEESNDLELAAKLSWLGDIFVNDAFSCCHRAHASTVGITQLLPAFAGPLLVEEIETLNRTLSAPRRPAVAIVGGAKVSSKIAVLRNLVARFDTLIIAGGMANTFLFASGAPMGRSLFEEDQVGNVNEVLAMAERSGCRIMLPVDIVTTRTFSPNAPHEVMASNACPRDAMILDAGPTSVLHFKAALKTAQTILWNGPLGAFELPPFDGATTEIAKEIGRLTRSGQAISVAGGGDTVAALTSAGVSGEISYVSMAGGAFLEWLEGRDLPGLDALACVNRTEKEAV